MYTRRTLLMFVFAILSLACNAEIPLVVALFAMCSMILQRRWRSCFLLFALAGVWAAVVFLYVIPHFSPTGQPLLVGRYGHLGKGPVQILTNIVHNPRDFLKQYVLEPNRIFYLRVL